MHGFVLTQTIAAVHGAISICVCGVFAPQRYITIYKSNKIGVINVNIMLVLNSYLSLVIVHLQIRCLGSHWRQRRCFLIRIGRQWREAPIALAIEFQDMGVEFPANHWIARYYPLKRCWIVASWRILPKCRSMGNCEQSNSCLLGC